MSNCYPTPESLQNFQKDVETTAEYANGDNGVPNINRDGEDVGNLQTLNARALEIAAGAANLQTYLTKAAMDADTSQPVPTVGQVTNDPDPANNKYYVWNGTSWVVSGIQPATQTQLDALRVSLVQQINALALNFGYVPYADFDDAMRLGIVDRNGRKLDSDTLVDLLRRAGQMWGSPYESFNDAEAFLMVDKIGRVLEGGSSPSGVSSLWSTRTHVQYVHASKEVYVSWPHDRTLMFRVLWKPNGHNSLFNFRSLWWAPIGDPADADWTLIQTVTTDYVPPITHYATTGDVSPNVFTTGGNHAGANGEITAVMQYCRVFVNGAYLSDNWTGYASDVVTAWQNLLYAGNTINEQRFTTVQDMRARFGPRTTEIVSRVEALEPIMIWREGGTQMVGTGYLSSYHFYGGVQQRSVPYQTTDGTLTARLSAVNTTNNTSTVAGTATPGNTVIISYAGSPVDTSTVPTDGIFSRTFTPRIPEDASVTVIEQNGGSTIASVSLELVTNSGTKLQAPTCWACVLKDPTLGYMAAWIDRGYGIGMDGVTDVDTPATKNDGDYKFYNFPIKFEALPHYVMAAGDSYSWRGGYSYAPIGLVEGLDSGFLFSQNGRLRIAIANTASDLGGTVVLPDEIPTTDFETVGGLDSIGVPVVFGAYSATSYKEAN